MITASAARTGSNAAHANFGKSRKLTSEKMGHGLTRTIAELAILLTVLIVGEHTMGNGLSSAL